MSELISGVAKYVGTDKKRIKQFGNTYHVMYNAEGDYVRTRKNKQIILNDTDWVRVPIKDLQDDNWQI